MLSKRNKFYKNDFNSEELKNKRLIKSLSLRKNIIDEIISNKRFEIIDLNNDEMDENADINMKIQDFNISQLYLQIQKENFNICDINIYSQIIFSSSELELLRGIIKIRKCLSDLHHPPNNEVISNGVITKLLKIILDPAYENSNIFKFEILWIFVNIASGEDNHVKYLLENNIIEIICTLMNKFQSIHVVDQLIWLIANLSVSADSKNKQLMLQVGILKFLVKILCDPNYEQLTSDCIWGISNLLIGVDKEIKDKIIDVTDGLLLMDKCCCLIESYLIKDVENFKKQKIESIIIYSLMTILHLTESNLDFQMSIINIINNLIKIINMRSVGEKNYKIMLINLLRILANLSNNKKNIAELINNDILNILKTLFIKDSFNSIRQLCCIIFSNISVYLDSHTAIFNQDGFLNLIFQVAKDKTEKIYTIKNEMLRSLANLTYSNNYKNIMKLIDMNIISVLSCWLSDDDFKVCVLCLEALENVLKFCFSTNSENLITKIITKCENDGLIDQLDFLCYSNNSFIAEKSLNLFSRYLDILNTSQIYSITNNGKILFTIIII